MDRKTVLNEVYSRLKKEYPDAVTFLNFSNPFELMIAVILSARTTDAQVNRVTPVLFGKYPDPFSLMLADKRDVERIVFSTGFYKVKAGSIIGAAAAVAERFGGTVPRTMEDLLTIPGVGRKSANVIRAHCFNMPSVIVDTHFARVVSRIGLVSGKTPDQIEREITSISSAGMRTDFSMVVNVHGRTKCTSRSPGCSGCVLRNLCAFAGDN